MDSVSPINSMTERKRYTNCTSCMLIGSLLLVSFLSVYQFHQYMEIKRLEEKILDKERVQKDLITRIITERDARIELQKEVENSTSQVHHFQDVLEHKDEKLEECAEEYSKLQSKNEFAMRQYNKDKEHLTRLLEENTFASKRIQESKIAEQKLSDENDHLKEQQEQLMEDQIHLLEQRDQLVKLSDDIRAMQKAVSAREEALRLAKLEILKSEEILEKFSRPVRDPFTSLDFLRAVEDSTVDGELVLDSTGNSSEGNDNSSDVDGNYTEWKIYMQNGTNETHAGNVTDWEIEEAMEESNSTTGSDTDAEYNDEDGVDSLDSNSTIDSSSDETISAEDSALEDTNSTWTLNYTMEINSTLRCNSTGDANSTCTYRVNSTELAILPVVMVRQPLVPKGNRVFGVMKFQHGEEFLQDSILGVVDSVEKLFLFYQDLPWNGSKKVTFQGSKYKLPQKIDRAYGEPDMCFNLTLMPEVAMRITEVFPTKIVLARNYAARNSSNVSDLVNEHILPKFGTPDILIVFEWVRCSGRQ